MLTHVERQADKRLVVGLQESPVLKRRHGRVSETKNAWHDEQGHLRTKVKSLGIVLW
jgi:hypothetical protein